MLKILVKCSKIATPLLQYMVVIGTLHHLKMTGLCSLIASLSSVATVRTIIPAILMQPTHELTVQEHPAISHKRNVSRATIKNAAYKIDGIFLLSVMYVSSRDIHHNAFAPSPN